MGCGGSKPKKEAPIRKKSTINKKQASGTANEGQASATINGNIQGKPDNGTKVQAGANVELHDDNINIENNNLVAADDEEESFGGEPPTIRRQVTVSNNYNKEDIKDIEKDFENKSDDEIAGEKPTEVKLFGKDRYTTEYWTPVLFAIYNKELRAVRYFMESKKVNPRYSTKRRVKKPNDTRFDQDVFPLILTMHNQDDAMLDYLWSMNELWDYEHLKIVLQVLFSRTHWVKGIEIILGCEASQDAYNTLPYSEKRVFLNEMFYRYLHQSDDNIKELIKSKLTLRPYALIALYFLMAENKKENDGLIKEALANITMEDYAKMKYESGKIFMDSWVETLNAFTKEDNNETKAANSVKKKIKTFESEMKKSKHFKDYKALKKEFDNLDKACEEGNVETAKKIVLDLDIRNLRRSPTPADVLLKNMITVETYWNALHIACFNGKLGIIKFILEECRIDAASVGRLSNDTYNSDRTMNTDYEAFPLYLTINSNHYKCFEYLWLDHGYFWDYTHLLGCINLIEEIGPKGKTSKFLKLLLESKTTLDIFTFLSIDEKVEFISFFDNPKLHNYEKYVQILTKKPFSWAYLVHKVKNMEKLDKKEIKVLKTIGDSLTEQEMEVPGRAHRSKTSSIDTMMRVMSKLQTKDENTFGQFRSVTTKLVNRDELKNYKNHDEDGSKLLTEIDEEAEEDDEEEGEDDEEEKSGDLEPGEMLQSSNFNKYVIKGKLDKIKLAMQDKTFIDILSIVGHEKTLDLGDEECNTELWNPLLFAIYYNKVDIVKYFVEECRINLKLAITDPEKREEEFDDISNPPQITEDLFGLFIAITLKHDVMFDYLWSAMRSYLIGEYLIEVLGQVVDSKWNEGISILLESPATHEIFISYSLKSREQIFKGLIDGALDYRVKNEEMGEYMFETLSKSPYCLNMILVDNKEYKEYISKARENLQENEMNYILFHNEGEEYSKRLSDIKDTKLSGIILQYQTFNQVHFNLKIGEIISQIMTVKPDSIDSLKSNPKLAHLNLHHNITLDKKALPKHLHHYSWSIPALALFTNNSNLFNSLAKTYKPLLRLLLNNWQSGDSVAQSVTNDETEEEYKSRLQSLCQSQHDLDTLFNLLENHASLFSFEEIYSIVHNSIVHGKGVELKVLNTLAVKSWFVFLSEESQVVWIENMFDAVEENEDNGKVLGDTLFKAPYANAFMNAKEDEYEAAKERAENEGNDSEEEGDDEDNSDEAESASDDNDEEEDDNDEEEDEADDSEEEGDDEEAESAEEESDDDEDEEEPTEQTETNNDISDESD